jgi:hypothetical protein
MDDLDTARHDGSGHDGSDSFSTGIDFLELSARSKNTADTEGSSVDLIEEDDVFPVAPDKVAVVASDESTIDRKRHVGFSSVQVHAAASMIQDESELTTRPQPRAMQQEEETTQGPPRTQMLGVIEFQDGVQARVSFSTVQIREYQIILSDNPGSPVGVPIGLGWDHNDDCAVLPVDIFEERSRRSKFQFQLAPMDRVNLLKQAGYSASEIKKATEEVDRARHARQRTLETFHFTYVFEALEKAQRAVLNETTRKSEKRKERVYLKPYRPRIDLLQAREWRSDPNISM